MQRAVETIGGVYQLLLLALRSRFGRRNPYWRWRYETAFGTDRARRPPRREQIRAILDFGRWLHRMKRRRW